MAHAKHASLLALPCSRGLPDRGLAIVPVMDLLAGCGFPSVCCICNLNTFGIHRPTAIGTLQVLMPTILAGPDVRASARLRRSRARGRRRVLDCAGCGGVSPEWRLVRWTPCCPDHCVLLYVIGRPGLAWIRRYGWSSMAGMRRSGESGRCGRFVPARRLGASRMAFGRLNGYDAVPAFIAVFCYRSLLAR